MKILDKDKLLKDFDEAEVHHGMKYVYLGSILEMGPSGKFYTPFACSNVTPCPKCKGTGGTPNKHHKKKKHDRLEVKLIKLTMATIQKYGSYWNWPPETQTKINKIRKQQRHWQQHNECDQCGACGSQEAWLDEKYWCQIEMDLEEIGAFRTSSEGDGCDVLAAMVVEDGT